MKTEITAKFKKTGNRTIFKGYDIIAGGQVVAWFYSEYDAIVYVQDNEGLRLT